MLIENIFYDCSSYILIPEWYIQLYASIIDGFYEFN